MKLILPWPPSILNPNSRAHWGAKSKATKKYRRHVGIAAMAGQKPSTYKLKITFHPPTKHRRDRDNCIAAFKAGQDGLADAWGVDDYIFNDALYMPFGEIVKHGAVVVEELRGLIVDKEV